MTPRANLTTYRQKRNFKKTAEPAGKSVASRKGTRRLAYIIQKHDASHLHYDFRLELDGVLKSWAVPKGPSLNPADKVLAVEVEDHPVEYGTFEGTIPEGEYGGGTVMLWDRGTWEPVGDPRAGLKAGKLTFQLEGERLQGEWALVRMRPRPGDSKNNWLLIKHKDEFASEKNDAREKFTTSVSSERSLEEIAAAGGTRVKTRGSGAKPKPKVIGAPKSPARRAPSPRGSALKAATSKRAARFRFDPPEGAIERPIHKDVSPQLATLVDAAPTGKDWIHEVKFDGYRIVAVLDAGEVKLISRNNHDWTHRFATIAAAVKTLPVDSCVIDGEAVALNDNGQSDFQALQNMIRNGDKARIAYYAFDAQRIGGFDFRGVPLVDRKRVLKGLLDAAAFDQSTVIRYSDHIAGEGGDVAENACRLGLEGIISKLASSPYRQRRTTDWVKTKCSLRQEFVIGGFTEPRRSRPDLGALLLGHYEGGKLRYAGKVGAGFTEDLLRDMRKRLNAMEQPKAPFVNPPRGAEAVGTHWVRPALVGEVQFTGWTSDGRLRHPAFQGLRLDKKATEVVRETPRHIVNGAGRAKRHSDRDHGDAPVTADMPSTPDQENGMPATRAKTTPSKGKAKAAAAPDAAPAPARSVKADKSATVAGVRISNPDRVVYPDVGVTKRQVAEYYESVGERIGPHLLHRAVSVVRCPSGVNGQKFYQKNLHAGMPAGLASVHVKLRETEGDFIVCDDLTDVISLVQMNVLEFHPWGSTVNDLERPDRIVFDLDPDVGLGWEDVVAAAKRVRTMLKDIGLVPFLKTTGGKGLHVVAPLKPKADWDTVKAFTLELAEHLASDEPERYTTNPLKAKRKGRIFVDYLRNARGATSVAPYSTRAREGATVSMPITWAQLDTIDPGAFTVLTAPAVLKKSRSDPWKDFDDARVALPKLSKRR